MERALARSSAWFERTFQFSFPVELLPNLMARLRGTPARLEETLLRCPAPMRIEKPEGKWSAQEHAGHLLHLEALWLARVEDYAAGEERLTPADLSNRGTDGANYNGRPLSEILTGFRAARVSLLRRVDRLAADAYERAIPHPRLHTPMRLADHLYFAAEHDDHHLARIWELVGSKASLGVGGAIG